MPFGSSLEATMIRMTRGDRKVVVVTGASAGVGRATVQRFAQDGASIALLARGDEGLAAAERDVESAGGKALAIPTDVADASQVQEAAKTAEDTFGGIDIWINNAMTSVFAEFQDISPEEFERVTRVTYLGVVYGTMSALKSMQGRGGGVIVQVGSALAYRGIPLQSAYCGAKHAIQGFTESVRCELMHNNSGIHITMVQLPALNTPQFGWVLSRLPNRAQPVPPIFQPEVAAEAIYWAAYHHRREIYVGFSAVKAIVGNKMLPALADRYLAYTGYEAQQTSEPDPKERPFNLWEPVSGDRGAHGDFDRHAKTKSYQLSMTTHRWETSLGIAGICVIIILLATLFL